MNRKIFKDCKVKGGGEIDKDFMFDEESSEIPKMTLSEIVVRHQV